MIDNNVITENWAYIQSKAKVIKAHDIEQMFQDGDVPLNGKFYGKLAFLLLNKKWSGKSYKGTPRLFLRPFIYTDFEDADILCVYIDLKRYRFTEEGMVSDTKYEAPIYIIVR